ncbi:MAG: hypothetical protein EON58_08080 [Alphaproteobacteria bacterium]|nr:MAG: hypothetical protein EON58_08080 [Alphaproteobacteria bacterium]
MATLVDVAATMEILRETAEICKLILENTNWQIRLLSKSSLLKLLVTKNMIATEYHHRLIMGFSTGTLDDRLAASIEKGTSPVSKRIKALHELQDLGIRTFGMICPSLPYASQEDYDSFSRAMCEALRIDRCEHVWAEVINVRGHSLVDTVKALRDGGYTAEAERVEAVSGTGKAERWEEYARMTFEAHKKHVPADKLRFLQYLGKGPADYWSEERGAGVVLLGKEAVKNNLLSFESSGEIVPFPALEKEDVQYHAERVDIVSRALNSAFLAARALFEIKTYKDGILWKIESKTFEEYCARQWKYQKSQAYRLLGLGRFLSKFPEKDSPFGEDSPVRESHLRPVLEKVPEEHQMACWESYGETASAGKVTAASVRSHVEEYLAKKGLDVSADLTPERWWRDRARARVKLLEADFAKLGFAKESARLLEQLVALIDGAQVAAGADGTNLNDPRG